MPTTILHKPSPISILHYTERRLDMSPSRDTVSCSPESTDSVRQEIAARRVGERSVTPYPPPMYSPRVTFGNNRSVTPYPDLRRWPSRDGGCGFGTPSSTISASKVDEEDESLDQSRAPSPSSKEDDEEGETRGRTLSRVSSCRSIDSHYTFGVPTNTPLRSLSRSSSFSNEASPEDSKAIPKPVTPPVIARALEDRMFEIEVARRVKEMMESTSADYPDLFMEDFEDLDLLCPPNSPTPMDLIN
ncbi:uncharacterized protein FOMMEDRAFT_161934 [Fomitiporia mediterranea MF3/22]|uniref:uncharacterized protein n=1 Tax=Fomitiporia mediterranea (strain MF3/22) TaxID=694068 RepID=UPI000440881D|nr:uncharacterized protein FOMMEDRAFT_161934 [Fomitiporia mediterranea MF3/22]EJC98182.1 hypothetical protein FOMMEDRAFT_161934 [Fomitiporia mediterranea MF3/22]